MLFVKSVWSYLLKTEEVELNSVSSISIAFMILTYDFQSECFSINADPENPTMRDLPVTLLIVA